VSRRNSLGEEQKTRHLRAADSANDAVPGDAAVRVPQNFINGKEFKGIDVGIDYKPVLALAKAIN
jgi:hypothetical protein